MGFLFLWGLLWGQVPFARFTILSIANVLRIVDLTFDIFFHFSDMVVLTFGSDFDIFSGKI